MSYDNEQFRGSRATEIARERDRVLAEYLAAMDSAGGGVYTQDFRDGFRHALVMVAACESDESRSAGAAHQIRPSRLREATMSDARETDVVPTAIGDPVVQNHSCPACGAPAGHGCWTPVNGHDTGWTHDARVFAAMGVRRG